jgi:hypothetical protein
MTDHRPRNELAEEMSTLKEKIEIGRRYIHYKNADTSYTVRGLVVIEATEVISVLYQENAGPKLTFVRPASEWLDMVEFNGKSVPRFRKA